MSTGTFPPTLEEAIRQAGEGWLIDKFVPQDEAMDHIRGTLANVQRLANERLRGDAPSFSEVDLLAEYRHNPSKVRGFFQALGGTRTPEMLLMVWRVIQGDEIKSINIQYQRRESIVIQVVLESPYGGEEISYNSSSIHDFTLFRHIGVLEIGGQPVFDGFYPLKIRGM